MRFGVVGKLQLPCQLSPNSNTGCAMAIELKVRLKSRLLFVKNPVSNSTQTFRTNAQKIGNVFLGHSLK